VIPRQPSLAYIKIDGKQQENVKYFQYLDSIITNDAKCKHVIKSRIAKGRAALNNNNNNNKNRFSSKLGLILRNKLGKYYIRSMIENWTLRKLDQKY